MRFLLPLAATAAAFLLTAPFAPAQSPAPAAVPAVSPTPMASPSATPKRRSHKSEKMATPAPSPASSPAAGVSPAPASAATPVPAMKTKEERQAAEKDRESKLAQMTPAPGGGPGMVWVNTKSKVYHMPDSAYYGKTKKGKYMTEEAAKAEGDHAAKDSPIGKKKDKAAQ